MISRPPYESMEDRLLANSVYNPENGCREWVGSFNNRGYPRLSMRVPGKKNPVSVYAHRLAWEIRNERKIPEGYTIDHTCENEACIEPEHLEPVTRTENSKRRWSRKDDPYDR